MAVNGGQDCEANEIHHKKCSTRLRGLIKAFWNEVYHLYKKNIHIYNFVNRPIP